MFASSGISWRRASISAMRKRIRSTTVHSDSASQRYRGSYQYAADALTASGAYATISPEIISTKKCSRAMRFLHVRHRPRCTINLTSGISSNPRSTVPNETHLALPPIPWRAKRNLSGSYRDATTSKKLPMMAPKKKRARVMALKFKTIDRLVAGNPVQNPVRRAVEIRVVHVFKLRAKRIRPPVRRYAILVKAPRRGVIGNFLHADPSSFGSRKLVLERLPRRHPGIVAVFGIIELKRRLHLPQIGNPPRVPSLPFHGANPHEHQGRENAHDRDNDEHFNQCKTFLRFPFSLYLLNSRCSRLLYDYRTSARSPSIGRAG